MISSWLFQQSSTPTRKVPSAVPDPRCRIKHLLTQDTNPHRHWGLQWSHVLTCEASTSKTQPWQADNDRDTSYEKSTWPWKSKTNDNSQNTTKPFSRMPCSKNTFSKNMGIATDNILKKRTAKAQRAIFSQDLFTLFSPTKAQVSNGGATSTIFVTS